MIYGRGFIGEGEYKSTVEGKRTKAYSVWKSMFTRCYSKRPEYSSYKDCEVDPSWFNFQCFAAWFYLNYVEDWELDKDLILEGNTAYKQECCCFVPRQLNCIFAKGLSNGESKGIHKHGNRWRATTSSRGVHYLIGSFSTKEEARQAYKNFRFREVTRLLVSTKDLNEAVKESILNKAKRLWQ